MAQVDAAAATPSHFLLKLPVAGSPRLAIDGKVVDAANILSVAVRAEMGEVTRLWIETAAGGVIEGDAIVHEIRDLDQREVVVEWLDGIDTAMLSTDCVKEVGGYGDDRSAEEIVMAVLARYARGGSSA